MPTLPRTDPPSAEGFAYGLLTPDTFWSLVEQRAASHGARTMLLDESPQTVTFRQFRDRAERVAAALRERGIGPGTRVAWKLPARISTALLMAALARLGAVQAPIIPQYQERETAAAVAAAAADYLIVPGVWRGVDHEAMAAALPTAPRVLVIGSRAPESAESATAALPAPPTAADAARWIYFTSGSSGLPKGVVHTDGTLLAASRGYVLHHRIGSAADEVSSVAFPIAHVGGIIQLMAMLLSGFPAVFVEAFDPPRTAEVFRRHRVTSTGASTVFYTALLAEQRRQPPGTALIPSLRLLTGGGAPCPPAVFHAARAELGATVAHDYGMTEVPMVCVARPDSTDEQLAQTDGSPIPGNELRIVGPAGEPTSGQVGEIQVRGAAVCLGYTDPAQTAEAFTPDGWFRTGDRGLLRPDGLVEVTGRSKDLIIRKGENISPLEIETLLSEHPAVAEVAVVGLPDEERGERVCAVLTLRADREAPTLLAITDFLRTAGIMPQKLPEQLELLAELPRTGLGKVSKAALREQLTTTARTEP